MDEIKNILMNINNKLIKLIIYLFFGAVIGDVIEEFIFKHNIVASISNNGVAGIGAVLGAIIGALIGTFNFKNNIVSIIKCNGWIGDILGAVLGLVLGAGIVAFIVKNTLCNGWRRAVIVAGIVAVLGLVLGAFTVKNTLCNGWLGPIIGALIGFVLFYIKSMYAVSEIELPLISITTIVLIAFMIIMYQAKYNFIKTATMIVPIISGCGLCLSYLYNKIAQRRLQIHSEANWRPRLYDLMAKENITYNDLLYLTAFFNAHKDIDEKNKENKKDIDIIIIEILRQIINNDSNKNSSSEDNKKLNELLNKLYTRDKEEQNKKIRADRKASTKANKGGEDPNPKNPSTTDYLLSDLIKKNSHFDKSIGYENTILFKACISELLKSDWKAQK